MRFAPLRWSRIGALLLLSALLARSAEANTIVLPASGEPSLLGHHGILATLYGLGNVMRIDDSADRLWPDPGLVTATVVARFAGLDQRFGYLPGVTGGAFRPLFKVQDNCLGTTCDDSASFGVAQSGPTFRFADQAGGVTWSSRPGDNPHSEDHMVSFLVTGGPDEGAYVIAFEDLPYDGGNAHGESHHGDDRGNHGHDKDHHDGHDGHGGDDAEHHGHGHESQDHEQGGKQSDRDFNDLVLEVTFTSPSQIPEPEGFGLFGTGLLALGVLLRRSKQPAFPRRTL